MTGLMGAQATTGSWADMQNAAAAAASFYQRQAAGLTGSAGSPVSSFDPSSSSKIRGLPYRTSVRIYYPVPLWLFRLSLGPFIIRLWLGLIPLLLSAVDADVVFGEKRRCHRSIERILDSEAK
jgi:hypothetical protein